MKIWCSDYRDHFYTDAAMRDVTRFRGINFFRGLRQDVQFPSDAMVEVRSRRPPTDFFKAGVFWIMSSKLRHILESHGVEAEYFAVLVVDKRENPLDGEWWCFNPTLVLDWFDRSQSRFVPKKDFALEIERIVVREEILSDVPLAVAEKTIPVLVATSDTLATAIMSNDCTGVVFREPRDWQNPVNPVR